jgi:hypothetical protein
LSLWASTSHKSIKQIMEIFIYSKSKYLKSEYYYTLWIQNLGGFLVLLNLMKPGQSCFTFMLIRGNTNCVVKWIVSFRNLNCQIMFVTWQTFLTGYRKHPVFFQTALKIQRDIFKLQKLYYKYVAVITYWLKTFHTYHLFQHTALCHSILYTQSGR